MNEVEPDQSSIDDWRIDLTKNKASPAPKEQFGGIIQCCDEVLDWQILFEDKFCDGMRREDAHVKLELLPDGSFIIRRNPENGQYALAIRYRTPKHIKIHQRDTGHYCLTDHVLFDSIPDLVEYFQQHSLESCFSQEVPTTLLYPYKTIVAEMQALAADKGFLAYCLALYDYAASEPNQLSICTYDVIGLISKVGDSQGWWKGYLDGRVGYFPKTYVTAEGLDV